MLLGSFKYLSNPNKPDQLVLSDYSVRRGPMWGGCDSCRSSAMEYCVIQGLGHHDDCLFGVVNHISKSCI